MIYISIPVKFRKLLNESRLETAATETLNALNDQNSKSVVVKMTGDRELQKLNKTYRGIDKPTDVLSFENDYTDPETGEQYLGDIVISLETAAIQAEVNANSLQHEVEMLLVHGVLHLAGHDHATKAERDLMSNLQDKVLDSIRNPLRESIQ